MEATFGRWEALLKRYAQFMRLTTPARIALVLIELTQRFGISDDRGQFLPFVLTHEMLAAMVGASRQHVTTVLSGLAIEKAVSYENHRLRIVANQLKLAVREGAVGPSRSRPRCGPR